MSSTENAVEKYINGILVGDGELVEQALANPAWMEGLYPNILFWLSCCPVEEVKAKALDTLENSFHRYRDILDDGTLLLHVQAAKGSQVKLQEGPLKDDCLATDRYGVTPAFYATLYGRPICDLLYHAAEEDDRLPPRLMDYLRTLYPPLIPSLIDDSERCKHLEHGLHEPGELEYIYGLLYSALAAHPACHSHAMGIALKLLEPYSNVKEGPLLPLVAQVAIRNNIETSWYAAVSDADTVYPGVAAQLQKIHGVTLRPRFDVSDAMALSEEILALYQQIPNDYLPLFDWLPAVWRKVVIAMRGMGTAEEKRKIEWYLYQNDLLSLKISASAENWENYIKVANRVQVYLTRTKDYNQLFELMCNLTDIAKRLSGETGQDSRQKITGMVLTAFSALSKADFPRQRILVINEAVKRLIRDYLEVNPYSFQARKLRDFVATCFNRNRIGSDFTDQYQELLRLRNFHRDDLIFCEMVNYFFEFLRSTYEFNKQLHSDVLYEFSMPIRQSMFRQHVNSYGDCRARSPFYTLGEQKALLNDFDYQLANEEPSFHFANACLSILSVAQQPICAQEFRRNVANICERLLQVQNFDGLHPSVIQVLGPEALPEERENIVSQLHRLIRLIDEIDALPAQTPLHLKSPLKKLKADADSENDPAYANSPVEYQRFNVRETMLRPRGLIFSPARSPQTPTKRCRAEEPESPHEAPRTPTPRAERVLEDPKTPRAQRIRTEEPESPRVLRSPN